eukprot:CAMPEP_0197413764 /NCGR_PEP_ID=MMETSP1170-20131217/593_1 /TAXON_ID=54406 /ORGANISM="Sarcinochrysis sp, Strain CCMP770" /LENGTH=68 /DNA_ID=CAMNT_0042940399 /DNA_START=63 /DNA_END=269 /DNA_ORIENTATION=+
MGGEMKISESECLKLAKLLDSEALPVACKDYVSKNQKNKTAWEGASHRDFMISKHTQLQRRLTSSRVQ